MRKKVLSLVLALCMVLTLVPGTAFAAASGTETSAGDFSALQTALTNTENTTIKLTNDIPVTGTLTVNHTVTIVGTKTNGGNYQLTRGDSGSGKFAGTMFTISNGAALTLQGVTIDAGGKWSFNQSNVDEAKETSLKFQVHDIAHEPLITASEGVTSTANLIVVAGGTLTLDGGTKISGFYAPGSNLGVVYSNTENSKIEIKNAELFNNTSNHGVIVGTGTSSNITVNISDGAKIYKNYATFNGGLFDIYTGATLTISGGEIYENVGYNSNGVVCMAIGGELVMNGGKIYENLGLKGPNNVWDQVIYVHSKGKFTMTAGEIYKNTGCRVSALAQNGGNGDTIVLNGGTIRDNVHYTQEKWDGDSWGDIAIGSKEPVTQVNKDFTFGGNVYVWGEGKLNNKGTFTGNFYLMSFEQGGTYYFPEVTNNGIITGSEVRIHDGSLFTNGTEGKVEADVIIEHMPGYTGDQKSRFENDGSIIGNVTIAVGGNAVNKGNITGNIDIKAGGELILDGDGTVNGNITVYPGGDIRAAENEVDEINGKLTLEYKDAADLERMEDIFRSSGLTANEVEYKLHEHTNDGAKVEGKHQDATCTEPGYDTYTCTTCLDEYQVELPAKGHTKNGDGTPDKQNPLCTEVVTTEFECTECHTKWTEITKEAKAHTLVANGNGGFRCRECDYVTTPTSTGGSTCTEGHTWDSGTVTKAATCTEAGTRKLTCTVCGATMEITVPATGHTWGELKEDTGYSGKVGATCETEGKRSLVRNCTVCSAVDETSRVVETIPMIEHKAPTGTYKNEDGKRCTDEVTFTCETCKQPITVNGKAHTWGENGTGTECTVCGETRTTTDYVNIAYQYPGAVNAPEALQRADHILYAQNSTATLWQPAEGEVWAETFAGVPAVFVGWSDTHIVAPYAAAPADITLLTSVSLGAAEVQVYAVWAEDRNGNGTPDYDETKYTIEFDLNGGTGATVDDMTDLLPGIQYVLPQPTGLVDASGNRFAGWLTTQVNHTYNSEHTEHNDLLHSYTAETAANVTLYAVYADNTYASGSVQVHYHANGGTPVAGSGVTVGSDGIFYNCTHFHQVLSFVPVDEMFSLTSAQRLIQCPGAVLVGWSDALHNEIYTTAEAVNNVLTHGVTMGSDGATLYAVWAVDKTGDGVADYLETQVTLTHTWFDNASLGGTLPEGTRADIKGALPAADKSSYDIGDYIEFNFSGGTLTRTDYKADGSVDHHYVHLGWSGYVHGVAASATDAANWLLTPDTNPNGESGKTYRWLRDTRFQTAYAVWAVDDNRNGVPDYADVATQPTQPEPTYPSFRPAPSTRFYDVDQTEWYTTGIDYVVKNGLMGGVSETDFAPEAPTTRAMLVTILYRLDGEPAVTKNIPFSDVASGTWYSDAINWAAANEIVGGYGDNTFRPDRDLTREEAATILYRYAKYKEYDVTTTAALTGYTDAASVQSYATAPMSWAVGTELINGTSATTLAPNGGAIRAQIATILMRFCENVVK